MSESAPAYTPPTRRTLPDGMVEELVELDGEDGWAIDQVLVKVIRGDYSVQPVWKFLGGEDRVWYGPTRWYTRTTYWKPCGVRITDMAGGVVEGYWVQWWNTSRSSRRERPERPHDRAEQAAAVPLPESSSKTSGGSTRSRSSRRRRRRHRQRLRQHHATQELDANLAAAFIRALSLSRMDLT